MRTLIELLDYASAEYGERVAAVYRGDSLTYADLARLVESFSRNLRARFDVGPGSRVALVMPNCIHSVICYLGVIRTGAVAVPVNIRLKAQEMKFILQDAGAHVVIAHERTWPTVSKVIPDLPAVHALIGVELDAEGVVPVEDLTRDGGEDFPLPDLGPDDVAAIIYTSGTTGLPKGAMITHGNILFNVKSTIRGHGFRPDDVHMLIVPLFHVTGLNTILPTSLHLGSTVVITAQTNPSDVLGLIEQHRATTLFAVPTTMILLTRVSNLGDYDLSSLRLIAYSGAPMPVRVIERLRELFPDLLLHNFFGLTETTSVTTVLPSEFALSHAESIGRLVPELQAKIVGPEGEELGPGEVGELLIKGRSIVKGYHDRPEATAEAIVDGWLHTGDNAMIDADGFIFLRGRSRELIIVAGENVYPVEVENVLTRHPKVAEAAAVGIAHDVLGQVVKAVVVPERGAELTEREVKRHCTEHLASFKVPQVVEFRDGLPRNPSGKVVKRDLA